MPDYEGDYLALLPGILTRTEAGKSDTRVKASIPPPKNIYPQLKLVYLPLIFSILGRISDVAMEKMHYLMQIRCARLLPAGGQREPDELHEIPARAPHEHRDQHDIAVGMVADDVKEVVLGIESRRQRADHKEETRQQAEAVAGIALSADGESGEAQTTEQQPQQQQDSQNHIERE